MAPSILVGGSPLAAFWLVIALISLQAVSADDGSNDFSLSGGNTASRATRKLGIRSSRSRSLAARVSSAFRSNHEHPLLKLRGGDVDGYPSARINNNSLPESRRFFHWKDSGDNKCLRMLLLSDCVLRNSTEQLALISKEIKARAKTVLPVFLAHMVPTRHRISKQNRIGSKTKKQRYTKHSTRLRPPCPRSTIDY